MKQIKLLLSTAFLCCLFCLIGTRACAADGYSYVVRVFSGNQGTIGESDRVVMPAESATFDPGDVIVTSDLYYAKGIRESGKDINPYYTDVPKPVIHDTDYVVVYGLKTSRVTLTIRHVDSSGAKIAEDRSLYANIGDTPTVKAAFIENYAPYYRFIKKTLSGDETWTFEYYPYSGDATVIYEGGGGAWNANPWQGNNTGAGGNAVPVTEDILDLDTPLAGPDSGTGTDSIGTTETPAPTSPEAQKRLALLAKIGLCLFILILLAGIGFLYWFLLFYRKKKKRDSEAGAEEPYRKD